MRIVFNVDSGLWDVMKGRSTLATYGSKSSAITFVRTTEARRDMAKRYPAYNFEPAF